MDEFDGFLTDISSVLEEVVEAAPWRRRLAAAILRWGGEGIVTRRLEAALDAEEAPDLDALLDRFDADVQRLREVARALPSAALSDAHLLRDPDRVAEAEALLVAGRSAPPAGADVFFLDRERLAWDWLALGDRIVEEQR